MYILFPHRGKSGILKLYNFKDFTSVKQDLTVEIRELRVLPFILSTFKADFVLNRKSFQKEPRLDNGKIISAKVTDYHQHQYEPRTDGDAAIQEASPRKEHKTQQRATEPSASSGSIRETAGGSCVRYAIVIIA